ncbi:MAG: xanthine dehydrogenase family protein subunit M [Bacteroidetes bacterium]|nr:xanthine dehydrogenase family protein subunit M [Bacteroidota bacterium]MBL6963181.1 xanthine dehydrogenase family protein subunit M [Bacteroidota bacterium]
MYVSDFTYLRPKNLEEALDLLQNKDDAVALAGGTDLLVELKTGVRLCSHLVSLADVEEFKFIKEDEKSIQIGAGITHSQIMQSSLVKEHIPALALAASKIGSHQVRNNGTLGGNICSAAACCDSAPVLISLNAQIEILDATNKKIIPLEDLFQGNKINTLKKGQLVSKVIIPKTGKGTGVHYEKFGLREAMAVSVVSVSVMLKIKNESIENASVVIGAVAPTPKVSVAAVGILIGTPTHLLVEKSDPILRVSEAAVGDSIPIDDIRGGAQYRRDVLFSLTQRCILKALESAQKNV